MKLSADTTKAALLVALTLALAGCGKQDEKSSAASTAGAASASIPAGNGDKTLLLAECDKLPDPKATDNSAAGRATAVSQGVAARAACRKEVEQPNADLARIREIMEKEQAGKQAREVSNKEWFNGVKEGGKKPIRDLKY